MTMESLETPLSSSLKVYPVRFLPGVELKSALLDFVKKNGLQAAFVLTCCGSVTKATLRLALNPERGAEQVCTYEEHFEICSLVGTLSGDRGHLHITLGRADGSAVAGHVVGDLIIFTTAEVVIGECQDLVFSRKLDTRTKYPEFVAEARNVK